MVQLFLSYSNKHHLISAQDHQKSNLDLRLEHAPAQLWRQCRRGARPLAARTYQIVCCGARRQQDVVKQHRALHARLQRCLHVVRCDDQSVLDAFH